MAAVKNSLRTWIKKLRQNTKAQFTTRGVFTAAFTSEKRWMTIKKSLFRIWPLILNFFIAHLSILVRCKTKGAVGALCALPHIWPLRA
jgi:hypothetical protein